MLIKPEDVVPAYRLKVFVDGKPILYPYLVDTDEGFVEYHVTDFDGFFVRYGDDIMSDRTYGDITFKIE